MKRWLVVELDVAKEFGEGVSNFLTEHGATGIEEFDGDPQHVKLRTYFREDGKEKRILQDLYRYLKSLKGIAPKIPLTKIKTASIPEQDWGENWKRFFKPIQVTSKFVIKPPWSKIRLKREQIPIEITPGMAFGTGTHATTILCIRALEERMRKRNLSVLDVGTGSGILSIIAARLGAKEVVGIDIDPLAMENARENVEKNGVSNIVKLRKGSIGTVHKKFNVVVVNIDFKRLKRMTKPLSNHLENGGVLILSGILEKQEEKIRLHYLETGVLRWIKMTREGEWICLIFKKK
ncbi:MAG: 50S ribosomal protein L11 methyltransferase [Thermodesulfobacteriota bacterium]